jgi:hypothetical protein
MYHGEELAKANHATVNFPSQSTERGGSVGRAIRQASIPGLISTAGETRNYATDRLESLQAISSRAVDIATRLTGSFPVAGPDRGAPATGEKSLEPSSALDALALTVGEIRRPLSAMDEAFARLVSALDQIENALG